MITITITNTGQGEQPRGSVTAHASIAASGMGRLVKGKQKVQDFPSYAAPAPAAVSPSASATMAAPAGCRR